MRKGFLLCSLLVLFAVTSVDASERWLVEFKPIKMSRVVVKSGETVTPYWYLVYTVKNPTDEAINLSLSIKARSDVGKLSYTEWYNPEALAVIKAREGKAIKNVREMRCEIGPGESIKAVALFRNVHEGTDLIEVQVSGLCDRVYRERDKLVFEDRVLCVYYFKPGDEYYPQFDRITFKGSKWVTLNRQERAFR